MWKLLRNITLEIIRLNRIDSLYDPQSIRITYYEQNVKRGRALFLFLNCLDSSGREGWPYLLLYDHTVVSDLAFILTYNVEFYGQSNTEYSDVTILYCELLSTVLAVITTRVCLSCTQSDDWEHPRTCTSACKPRPPGDWYPKIFIITRGQKHNYHKAPQYKSPNLSFWSLSVIPVCNSGLRRTWIKRPCQ